MLERSISLCNLLKNIEECVGFFFFLLHKIFTFHPKKLVSKKKGGLSKSDHLSIRACILITLRMIITWIDTKIVHGMEDGFESHTLKSTHYNILTIILLNACNNHRAINFHS